MQKNHNSTQQNYTVSTYINRGLTLVSGEGAYLYDENGEKHLDMMSNYGVNVLGYGNQVLNERLSAQLNNLTNLHSSFSNDARAEASSALVRRVQQSGFNKITRVYWSNSGTEAVEAAIKFALLYSGKSQILAARGGYHGKTLGALAVTTSGGSKYSEPFKAILPKVNFFNFNDIKSFKSELSEDSACVILEPIQGENGVIPATDDFLLELSQICNERNIVLIIDEIQTGTGRTGTFLYTERLADNGFEPNIICLAKGIGGGIPVGATLVTERINSSIVKGIQTSTFGGMLLAMTGVATTIELINSTLLQNVTETGEYFLHELMNLRGQYPKIIKEVRGVGLMLAIEFYDQPQTIIKQLQTNNILAAPSSGNVIRLLPPLIITKVEVDITVSALKNILSKSS